MSNADEIKCSWVMYTGHMVLVGTQVMDELGLKQGQIINDTIFTAVLEAKLALFKARSEALKNTIKHLQ